MAHKWNQPVNRHVAHSVTCTLCGVFVERVFEGTRGVNYNTVAGGERVRGLAPKCPGKIAGAELALAADAINEDEQDEQLELSLESDVEPDHEQLSLEDALADDEDDDDDNADDEPADADEDETDDEMDETENDETARLAALCEKYEAMSRKQLDKIAAGKVKNYKRVSKASLALELAVQEMREQA